MPSFSENIQKLKNASRQSTTDAQNIETQAARERGEWGIDHARKVALGLAPFSDHLRDWKRRDIKAKEEEGAEEARKADLEKARLISGKAKAIAEIEEAKDIDKVLLEFENAKAQDTRLEELQKEILDLEGEDYFSDVAKLDSMNPYKAVGFAKHRLGQMGESYQDQLIFAMNNSKDPIVVNGLTIRYEDLHDPLVSIPIKRAALEIVSDRLDKKLGLHRFSKPLKKISGIQGKKDQAKANLLAQYRQDFNETWSNNKRKRAELEFESSDKNGDDIRRLILKTGNTISSAGKITTNAQALDATFAILQAEGILKKDSGIADHYAAMEIPHSFARQLGVKPGTKYGEKWPTRFASMKSAIKTGYTKQVNTERAYQEAFGTEIQTKFTSEVQALAAQGEVMGTDKVNEYKAKFQAAGLPIPEDITKWETTSMRNAREDDGLIKALKASQGGVITNDQLNQFNPLAAEKYRKEANAYEEGLLDEYDTENQIKAALDTTFTGMGLKGNEKNRIYREALKNAKADYINQYNKLRAMGFDAKHANYLALNGTPGEFKTKDGQPLVGFQGVANEIETRGEGSKYVRTGQNVQNTLGDAYVRVGYVHTAKEQIQKDPNSLTTGLLGGQYGQDQLNTIAANIEKFGLDRGLNLSTDQVEFYRGISNGTDLKSTGGWMGILDAQLKANIPGHQGLWPKGEQNNAVTLLTGRDINGQPVPDTRALKPLTNQAMRALANANSYQEFMYAINLLKDSGYDTSSIFDEPEQLVNYMGVN